MIFIIFISFFTWNSLIQGSSSHEGIKKEGTGWIVGGRAENMAFVLDKIMAWG